MIQVFVLTALVMAMPSAVSSSPPSPQLLERLRASGELQSLVDRMAAARANGIWPNDGGYLKLNDKSQRTLNFDPNSPDTLRALVIMVDFSDNPASGGELFAQPAQFQQILFSYSEYDGQYSMSEFYRDNSYGGMHLEGDVIGWYRMPHTYAYYVDNQNGWGPCPQCAAQMAVDAVLAADPDVDYSHYDADNNGQMDGLFILFAGEGADWTGANNQIWPHMGGLYTPQYLDGIDIYIYSMEPEEMGGEIHSFGVFAHEYGHYLGLPDLYDTDYSSRGIGDWSLMSFGSWNGNWGHYPAFFDAWCKSALGFTSPVQITENLTDVAFPDAQYNPVVYRVWENGAGGSEYFLVENRRAVGNDWDIPGSGMLIWHIDETQWGNDNEPHYRVSLEQADGRWDMEAGFNDGDGGDVWSTATQTDFDDLSYPNSRKWDGSKTKTAVWDISAADSVMYANLDINYSRSRFVIQSYRFSDSAFGNNDGFIDPGETISFTCTVENLWLAATNVAATMTSDNNDIAFDDPVADFGSVAGEGGMGDNNDNPIVFSVPSDFEPCLDSFFLHFTSDNPNDGGTLGLLLNIGPPQVLVVDDDNGDSWDEALTDPLFARRIPFDRYDKSALGSPSSDTLSLYPVVMWLTGDAREDILSAADIAAMKTYLDGGGGLFLTGQTIVRELDGDDQAFLNNYLRAVYDSSVLYPIMYGVEGSPIGDGLKVRYGPTANQTDPQSMEVINGSVPDFTIPAGATAISYDGDYRVVLFSFGFEAISDQWQATGWATKDQVFQRLVDFFMPDSQSLNPTIVSLNAVDESPENVVSHTPTFAWSVSDTTGGAVSMYEVGVGTGRLCYNSDDMWAPGVMTGDDSSAVYAGDPLEDGRWYVFRVRVNNGVTWSSWTEYDFKMNAIAAPGTPYEPVDDQLVATATPTLSLINSSDPDGDALTYWFELYDDASLTNLVASADSVPQGIPYTTWTVDLPLTEDQQYFWRTRVFDGFEFSPYSPAESFRVNAVNQPPAAFTLLSPPNGDSLATWSPTLVWQTSADNDPGDLVTYTLQVADNPGFSGSESLAGLIDTEATYSLDPNVWYYWRVIATDMAEVQTYSGSTFSMFYYDPPGCCENVGDIDHQGGPNPIDISDLIYLVEYFFLGGQLPPCLEEANVDGSSDGEIDISDLIYLVDYIFQGGAPPPPCP